MSSADSIGDIWLLPFFGQGHLLPTMELCKHIASRNFTATLIISSDLSPSIPSSLRHYPFLQVLEIPPSPPPPPSSSDPMHHHFARHSHMAQALRELLSARSAADLPLCAVVDVMMSWSSEIFKEFHIPMIGFFTSGACSAAMELALWNSRIENLNPGEIRLLPGLPESMAITELDFYRIAGGIRRSNRSGEILAWPVRGDQYYNAQLVVKHLKVGFKICEDFPVSRQCHSKFQPRLPKNSFHWQHMSGNC